MNTIADLASIVSRICRDLDTPRSLTVFLLVKNKEWGQIANLSVNPAHYMNADHYRSDTICTDLLRKCQGLETGIDTSKEARKSFFESEKKCALTNTRFTRHIMNGPFGDPSDMLVHNFLERVKNRVKTVLGPLPELINGKFGPGATFNDKGGATTILDKMSSQATITREARCLLDLWSLTAWSRYQVSDRLKSSPITVRGNRFCCVPKTAKTDRGIAIEPSLNGFFQLGVGKHIRARLHSRGIDLTYGQDLHRRLACESSRNDSLSTIDLSSASDTVSKQLVRFLMPDDWFVLLDCLRSPVMLMGDRSIVLEKFSSMGNGYTFELETLIFYCLSAEVCSSLNLEYYEGVNLSVYGDDIIIPKAAFESLSSVLRYCGFDLNMSKSYKEGYFRESCGGDFFNGVPVRGHFVKEIPHEPQQYIALANGIFKLGTDNYVSPIFDPRLKRGWLRALDYLPSDVRRLRGPVALGDICIHDNPDNWISRWKSSIRYIATYSPVSREVPLARWSPGVQFAALLYGVPSTGPIRRGSVSGYKVKWTSYS